jgi:asparagine synthase (glutamine-hydrolysing)
MTRKHVTVALSGDGGDELFVGYPRYRIVDKVWRRLGMAPRALRGAFGAALGKIPETLLDRLFALAPERLRPLNGGRKVHRLSSLLAEPTVDSLYIELAAIWAHEGKLVPTSTGTYRLNAEPDLAATVPDPVSRMQYYDTLTYLPDDIMTKVDRCSMAVALEAREPMLDHRLVEFVWKLPPRFKSDDTQSKRLLRQVLYRYVPRELVERPKMGFSIPLAAWLRGDLRAWADDLLSPARLRGDGIFAADEVRRLWDQHQAGTANRENVLWNVLMFQAWKTHYRL